MKHALFSLALMAGAALAQPTGTNVLPPTGPKPQAKPYPDCVPSVYGKQLGEIAARRTNEGRFIAWWCQPDSGAPSSWYVACVHGSCMPVGSFFEAFDEKRRTTDPITAVQQAWAAQMTPVCDNPTGTIATVCADMRKATADIAPPLPPVPPASAPMPVYTHAVKPNGTSTSRPAYLLTNGVRGTTAVGRADVGQPCDLTKPTLASGADVWASFGPAFESGKVALCTKK